MMVEELIARLQDESKGENEWSDVKSISGLSMLTTATSGVRGVSLFVFLQSDAPGADVRGTGPYLQSVTQTYAVVIVAKVVNGQDFDFEPIRQKLKEKLFGWSPIDTHEPFWLGAGRLLSLARGQASWIDTFVTEYTEDQNRYGA